MLFNFSLAQKLKTQWKNRTNVFIQFISRRFDERNNFSSIKKKRTLKKSIPMVKL